MIWALTLYSPFILFFFFNDTATTEIYTLSLHDALPISRKCPFLVRGERRHEPLGPFCSVPCRLQQRSVEVFDLVPVPMFEIGILEHPGSASDRKSTRLNSSHDQISYAVFCLKKKKTKQYRRANPSTPPALARQPA